MKYFILILLLTSSLYGMEKKKVTVSKPFHPNNAMMRYDAEYKRLFQLMIASTGDFEKSCEPLLHYERNHPLRYYYGCLNNFDCITVSCCTATCIALTGYFLYTVSQFLDSTEE